MLNKEDKKILETFKKVLPKLTDREKEKLLWFGEGMALKAESEEEKRRSA